MSRRLPWMLLLVSLLWLPAVRPAAAQENSRSSLQITNDEDGDVSVVMDTESIRMAVLPGYQACVSSFIFKPTGNDILSRMTIKYLQGGQGLLQDNFWEQDWRFSELRHKLYDFRIVSQGPEELAARFWTTSVGWLQADNSGVISDLLSNVKIERTIRMPAGKPYFLCDVALSIDMEKDAQGHAKLPQFWMHNMSIFTDDLSDEYQRPHTLGIAEQTKQGKTVSDDYVYAPVLAEGWSAQTSPRTKEGVVYLMDPSYVQSLYNCGNTTLEWFADNMLITKDRPLHTRVYILPVIGLDKVHFADPHMILRLTPTLLTQGNKGTMALKFSVSPSYKQIRSITFETWATYGLHERQPEKVRMLDPQPVVRNLRIESPQHATGIIARSDGIAFTAQTPLLIDVTAHVELLDADNQLVTKDVQFQYFHLGAYPTRKNEHLQGGEPLAVLDRVESRPWIPSPDPDLVVNRQEFKIFALAGPHFRHFHLPQAIERVSTAAGVKAAWQPDADAGYSVGFPAAANGLTTFPYDFDRLFQYRVFINCNSQTDITRMVGQSILAGYLNRGGGYLSLGGESAYAVSAPEGHALNVFEPVVFHPQSIRIPEDHRPAQLRVLASEHPIFKGNGKQAKAIDLSKLPQALSWHDLTLKKETHKPLINNPNEPLAIEFASLSEPLRQAIDGLAAGRRFTREEYCRNRYQALAEGTRSRLQAACTAVFKDFPPQTLQDGVFVRNEALRIKEDHKLDIRAAMSDFGDDQKLLVNEWIDANFARPNPIYLKSLPEALQASIEKHLRESAAGKGIFVRDGNWLLVPSEVRGPLFEELMVRQDELPLSARLKTLMELETPTGTLPFLVEVEAMQPDPADPQKLIPNPAAGRSLALLTSPFGAKEDYPAGVVPYWEWDQWEQLLANVLMYAGKEY